VNPGAIQVIDWRGERARLSPWQGDQEVAYLSPERGGRTLSAPFVQRCLDELSATGYRRVVTPALSPVEQLGFTCAGFAVAEPLCVLARDLDRLPERPAGCASRARRIALRKARADDRPRVLDVDHRAFVPFWRMDELGLSEALGATSRARFRVAVCEAGVPAAQMAVTGEAGGGDPGGSQSRADDVLGYAVAGLARKEGFLQRLAVDPAWQKQGIGSTLVLDAMRWLRRWRAARVHVNTHPGNEGAIALYEALGFRRQPSGLAVMAADLRT
jgi:ribosomal protein S18 acetylase RimI-like enzyme